jgi:hypothetical protein
VFSQNVESGSVSFKGHSIKEFVLDAEAGFAELLHRQSKDHEVAASEYSQRYHRDPLSGFEMRYDFAVKHESLIIGKFDIINETFSLF